MVKPRQLRPTGIRCKTRRLQHAVECDARCGKLAPGIPKSNLWASDPNGIDQVGCVYTAQGFEFDYVGVIFGRDLVYDAGWRGNRKISHDSVVKKAPDGEFVNLVKQTYRVLLTQRNEGLLRLFRGCCHEGVLP
jgi:uncharacterized protein